VKGRKRHVVTDTEGHLLAVDVDRADIQDRDGAVAVLARLRRLPGYAICSPTVPTAAPSSRTHWPNSATGPSRSSSAPIKLAAITVLPRRWVVERTFGCLGRCRRLAKDFEATLASAVAWVLIASIRLLVRRLARA